MGAIVPFERTRGRGRQSAEVEALRDARDEAVARELERRDRAAAGLALVRRAQQHAARGWATADVLEVLEAHFLRDGNQAVAALAAMRADAVCPDGETVRHLGHGRAA
jgi:hypothetical protein